MCPNLFANDDPIDVAYLPRDGPGATRCRFVGARLAGSVSRSRPGTRCSHSFNGGWERLAVRGTGAPRPRPDTTRPSPYDGEEEERGTKAKGNHRLSWTQRNPRELAMTSGFLL